MNRNKIIALLLVPAGAAVAASLMLLRLHFEPPAVGAYRIAIPSTAGVVPLDPAGSFELELRPEARSAGAVAARCFLIRGEKIRPWDPPVTVAIDGTVRIAGAVAELFRGVPSGPWVVAVAVGRPETLPTAPKSVLHPNDAAPGPASWHLLTERIDLRP